MKKISLFQFITHNSSFIICLATLYFILGTSISKATNYTWDGSSSSAWGLDSNWTPMGVPGAADNVTITSSGSSPQLSADVTVNNFTLTSGTLNLNGYNITVNGNGTFTAGTLSGGSSDTLFLTAGTATFTGGTINPYIHAIVATLKFNGSTFNGKGYFEANTNVPGTSNGGSTFNDSITIRKSYTTTGIMNLANVNANIYNAPVMIINNGTKEIEVSPTDTSEFYGDVTLEMTSTGSINFGSAGGGGSTFDADVELLEGPGGLANGVVLLRNVLMYGNDLSISFSGSAVLNSIDSYFIFSNDVSFTAPSVLLKNTHVMAGHYAAMTNTGNVSSFWSGGNTIDAVQTTILNSGTGAFRTDMTAGNTFNSDVIFNTTGGGIFRVGDGGESIIAGSLDAQSSSIDFSSGGGTLTFMGGNTHVKVLSALKNLKINKSGTNYTLTLDTNVTVSAALTLMKGNIVSTSSHLLTMTAAASVTGASDTSFVSGPVKKIGNSAFVFPIGKGGDYRALGISAPYINTDTYTAEFFNSTQALGSSLDTSTMESVLDSGYWYVSRNNGSSKVKATLYWGYNTEGSIAAHAMCVSQWNSPIWVNKGNSNFYNGTYKSYVTSSDSLNTFGYFILGRQRNAVCTFPDPFKRNYVQNEDFEYQLSFPIGVSQIDLACPWTNGNVLGTCDLFSGSGGSTVDIPTNQMGFLNDHTTGSSPTGYAGFLNYQTNPSNPSVENREYLRQTLYQTLSAGVYYVQFHYSLAQNACYTTDRLGIYFSNAPFIGPGRLAITSITPQVELNIGDYITYGWSKFEKCFQANGTERNMLMGNFYTAANSHIQSVGTPTPYDNYIHIDDVFVVKVADAGSSSINVCSGNSVTLGPSYPNPLSGFTHSWSPSTGLSATNIENPVLTLTNFTSSPVNYNYTVVTTAPNGCTDSDVISVTVYPKITASVAVTKITCNGLSNGSLTALPSGLSYLWNTGATTATISSLAPGIYTVTVSNGGCSSSRTVILINPPPLGVTFSQTGSLNPNCGGNMVLFANPSGSTGPYTYLWSTTATTQSIPVTTMGTYTVTVTSSTGCVRTVSFTTPEPGTSPLDFIIKGKTSMCTGIDPNPATYTIDPFDPTLLANYTITVSGGSVTTALNSSGSFSVTWSGTDMGGTIHIEVVDNGCTKENDLYVADCCRPSGYTVISNEYSGNVGAFTNSNTYYSSNTGIVINGTLTLNKNLTFENCPNITFGPGASIINNGFTLTIDDCNLRSACNDFLWKGIVLSNNASLVIPTTQSTGTTIADALYAINASNTAILRVDRTTFNKNYIGILTSDAVTLNQRITRCTFNGNNGSLLSAPSFTSFIGPPSNTLGYTGIYLKDVGINNISNPTGITTTNTFDGLCFGIYSKGGTLTVRDAVFQNIQPNGYSNLLNNRATEGAGINYIGAQNAWNILNQQGFGTTGTPSFTNCNYGIVVQEGTPFISNNNMTNMGRGIAVTIARGGGINAKEIIDNKIQCKFYGILDINSGGNSNDQVNIEDNEIIFNGTITGVTTGISISHSGNIVAPQRVYDNTITMTHGVNGITVNNSNTGQVYYNHIAMNGSSNVNGISVTGGRGVQIVNNGITASTRYFTANGINLSSTTSSLIQCNSIDNPGSNVRITSSSPSTVFQGNTMHRGQFGLILNAPMGAQIAKGNLWSSNPGNYNSAGANASTIAAVAGSRFQVKTASPTPTPPTNYSYLPPSISAPAGWFFSTTLNPWYCSAHVSRTMDDYILNPDSLYKDEFDTLVAIDSLGSYGFEPAIDWTLKKKLYEKLSYNGYLLLSDSIMQAFVDSLDSASIGRFSTLQMNIDSLYDVTSCNDSIIGVFQSEIGLKMELLDSCVNQLRTDTLSSSDSLIVVNVIDSIYDIVLIKRGLCDSLLNDNNTALDTLTIPLISDNESINVTEIHEFNFQSVYNIYLNTIARRKYVFTDDDKTVIEAIAQVCPIYGGDAVYLARAMLIMYNDSMPFNDTTACFGNIRTMLPPLNQENGVNSVLKNPKAEFIKFYPNPAKEQITFNYLLGESFPFSLSIYDTYGKRHFYKKYISTNSPNEDTIDTREFPPGIYYYFVTNGKTGKFIIVR